MGFLVGYFFLRWRIKNIRLNKGFQFFNSQDVSSQEDGAISEQVLEKKFEEKMQSILLDFLLVIFLFALIGGRIGYVFFYDPAYFFAHPLSIISPFDLNGTFRGIFGMSYHGALLGALLGSFLFLKKRKISFFAWADFVAPAIPLGYFFGRIGNFLNGELYGRATNSFVGMYFQSDLGRLRHPSQLYEALLEGLFLFLILWKFDKKKMRKGLLFSFYLIGYGLVRILVEFFRQPDAQIGLLLGFFSMGQVLSLVMIFFGFFLVVLIRSKK